MNMWNHCKLSLTLLATILFSYAPATNAQTVFDFESLPVPGSGFNNGDPDLSETERSFFTNVSTTTFPPGSNFGIEIQVDQTLIVSSNGAELAFPNTFSGTESTAGFDDFFAGFSYSNVKNPTSAGAGNRYAAFPGSGANGSDNYLVASGNTSFTASNTILSLDIAPTTYTALAIRDGDDGGAMFVSDSLSNTMGFFELIISGGSTGQQIIVPFGDFRGEASLNAPDFFQTIDVSILNARTLSFSYDGSDRDATFNFLNTPTFFAADNIVVAAIPEPSLPACLVGFFGTATFVRRRKSSELDH